ncbi:DUF2505 domain-containing protein [Mycobacterium sp. 852002-51057_SCH5723018]|uniref:DUF2505 domain-containing protein n=1 Tax=Mycobacterium sp. 852002-51057_SCH5723018 TaxID=1834094 RepID=UPI0007FECFF7|nr:DUF2505 domain-containing protein [Mycobacterium sp. 852002-51057_SCH5723018]OBG23337.1 hypothetical protein A5764_11320 [Mycobacterium sp. 852002-51057_SCH5723018]
MPRSFELSADYENSVEEIYRAFHDGEYWETRLADIPVDEARLESLRIGGESGDDGTIEVVTLQVVRSHNLHALVKQLHPGDFGVRRTETWGPLSDGVATASIVGSVVGAPVHVSGTAELSPIGESGGARLTFRITVKVPIPLIGGKVEGLIGTHLAELVSREQRLTADWIAQNA